jgi:hypothetical protein
LVYVKEIWVQNIGRAPAENVEVILAFAPNHFDIWPQRHFTNAANPNGNFVIKVDNLNRNEHFAISMLQVGGETPLVTNVRWSGGVGQKRPMAPQQAFGAWASDLCVVFDCLFPVARSVVPSRILTLGQTMKKMRPTLNALFVLTAILFPGQQAVADCRSTTSETNAALAAMMKAKDVFKSDMIRITSTREAQSPQQTVQLGEELIVVTERARRALDEVLFWLLKSRDENCFGTRADLAQLIPIVEKQRDELAATISGYRRGNAAIKQKYHLGP